MFNQVADVVCDMAGEIEMSLGCLRPGKTDSLNKTCLDM